VTWLWAGQSGVQISVGTRGFFLFQSIHSCYGVQPASYFMGAGGTLPSGKVSVGVRSWPLTTF